MLKYQYQLIMEIFMEKTNIQNYLLQNRTPHSDVLLDFLDSNENFYSRDNDIGHITSSAFILDDSLENVLLIHHKKYDMWLSPGGHVDAGETSLMAAERETGVKGIILLKPTILDVDIHRIPYSAKKEEPEHWHFDVRYLFKAPINASVNISVEECNGYTWKPLKELLTIENESLRRQAEKVVVFVQELKNKSRIKFKP